MTARLPTADGYELRYRLFPAAAAVDNAPLLQALKRALGVAGNDAEGNALRRVAVSALARNVSPLARELVLAHASDPDPGVRRRAAVALGQRADGERETDRALGALLSGDAWPSVRTAAAGALTSRCGMADAAAEALATAVEKDAETDVRIAALTALVSCKAHGIGARLIAIAGKRQYPNELRVRAATLVGALGDGRLLPELIALLDASRREAWSSEGALRIAAAAAGALGMFAKRDAVDALVRAAQDDGFPEVQAAALTSLGRLCPRDRAVGQLFERLSGSGSRVVAVSARAARGRCNKKTRR